MKNKKNNEELQSRREFFKKAAKGALPIIAATVLASAPAIVKAAEPPMDCNYGCSSGCLYYCSGGCSGTCEGSCSFGCSSTCSGFCSGACKGMCQQSCYGSCSNSCYGTCLGGCARYAYA